MANIENRLDFLLNHYIVICLFLTFFIFTFFGVGTVLIAGILGIVLCAVGMVNVPKQVDLRALIPLIIFNIVSMASSYVTFGNVVKGYASTELVFPVIYLLMAYLDDKELVVLRRLCVAWVGMLAAVAVANFLVLALSGVSVSRLGGLLGNPNALGIFLVIAWLALATEEQFESSWKYLQCLEPIILTALALTLSMGSFLAMAVGILVVFILTVRRLSCQKAFHYICTLLARASLGIGIGLLVYITVTRTDAHWIAVLLAIYLLVIAAFWRKFRCFLTEGKGISCVISLLGILAAGAAVIVRPSSVATFAERLEMMRNGLGYLFIKPLLGLGPYQWRIYNLQDSDKYFDTYHIHNVFIHMGVELGLIALAMLIILVIAFYRKKKTPAQAAGFSAFVFHNLIDTSFCYMGIVSLAMMTTVTPRENGHNISKTAVRIILGAIAAVFVFNLYVIFVIS